MVFNSAWLIVKAVNIREKKKIKITLVSAEAGGKEEKCAHVHMICFLLNHWIVTLSVQSENLLNCLNRNTEPFCSW